MDDHAHRLTDSDRRAEEIQHDIAQACDDLSGTIDTIQEKLRPRNIVAGATERVKQAATERLRDMQTMYTAPRNRLPAVLIGCGTAWLLMNRSRQDRVDWRADRDWHGRPGERSEHPWSEWSDGQNGGYGILERVKANPVPAILAGVGLTWLGLAGRRRHPDSAEYGSGSDYYDQYRAAQSRYGASPESSTMTDNVSETAGRVADSAREYAQAAAGTVSDAAGRAIDRASDAAGRAAGRAQEYARDAQASMMRTSRRAQHQFARTVNDNPLLISAGALIGGVILGLILPETEQENEWMGEARDAVLDKAQEAARHAATAAGQAAGDVATDVVNRVVGINQS